MITKFKTLVNYLKDKKNFFISRNNSSKRRMVNNTLYILMENIDTYFFEDGFNIEIEYFPYIVTRIIKINDPMDNQIDLTGVDWNESLASDII